MFSFKDVFRLFGLFLFGPRCLKRVKELCLKDIFKELEILKIERSFSKICFAFQGFATGLRLLEFLLPRIF